MRGVEQVSARQRTRRLASAGGGIIALVASLTAPSGATAYVGYVANLGSANVSIIDTSNGTAVGTIPVGDTPQGLALSPDQSRLYVVNVGDLDVSVIDTATGGAAAADIPVGTGPRYIAVGGGRAYVPDEIGDDVTVIDTNTNAVAGPDVAVGNSPVGVAMTPDGSRVYVPNSADDDVSVIDTATNTLAAPDVPVGNGPWEGIAASPDGTQVYVGNAFATPGADTVSVIDTATNTLAAPDITVGDFPTAIAFTPDGSRAYVANQIDGTVSVIDTATSSVVGGPIAVGTDPAGIAVTPDGTRVLVTNLSDNDVSVIDTTTNTVVGPDIPVGSGPAGVAISTASVPAPTPLEPTPLQSALPPPVANQTANVVPIEGVVLIKRPGESEFSVLESAQQIPLGSELDTRNGRVEIISASDEAGGTRSGQFWGGVFAVLQDDSEPKGRAPKLVTILDLVAKTGCGGGKASGPPATTSGKKGNGLWGSENGGGHSTSGNKGSGSTRGTVWFVGDSCNGTTTAKVTEGKVKFRDFALKKTVTLKQGDSYTAGKAKKEKKKKQRGAD